LAALNTGSRKRRRSRAAGGRRPSVGVAHVCGFVLSHRGVFVIFGRRSRASLLRSHPATPSGALGFVLAPGALFLPRAAVLAVPGRAPCARARVSADAGQVLRGCSTSRAAAGQAERKASARALLRRPTSSAWRPCVAASRAGPVPNRPASGPWSLPDEAARLGSILAHPGRPVGWRRR